MTPTISIDVNKLNIINKFIHMIASQIPKCGHEGIVLCTMLDQAGFYWHCEACSKIMVLELVVGGKDETRNV